jgi:uncharacterized protein (DUF1501 family)
MTNFPGSQENQLSKLTRRHFFGRGATGLGAGALAWLLSREFSSANDQRHSQSSLHQPSLPTLKPRAKRMVYLFQSGGPAQHELFDPKPLLNDQHGEQLPAHVRKGQRLTGMSSNQSSIPLVGSPFKFSQHGKNGIWLSELLPHLSSVADELCVVRSMFTEAINHDPAITFFQTGSQIAGRPSLGAWLSYGLGNVVDDLPSFVVLVTAGQGDQPLYARLWGSGFLDSRHQGVRFRSGKDPILYLSNPDGICQSGRRAMLDRLSELNQLQFEQELDPEIESRIAQYELAFKMQTSVPSIVDFSDEPAATFDLYGEDARKPGTYAANCLLARRLLERGVPFVQLYHQGWDHHGGLPGGIRHQTKLTDQPSAALVTDLKQRGMLDDTLVVWGGEFGRTAYCQGPMGNGDYGRDHHPRCFSLWMAGGGVRPGTYGQTDEYGYNIADADGNPIEPSKHHFTAGAVHVHDLQATMLHLLGFEHTKLAYRFQGRDFRLTDVHGHVVDDLII